VRHVLVLEPVGIQMPARPDPVPEPTKPVKKAGRK
jgi:hypothetical protein